MIKTLSIIAGSVLMAGVLSLPNGLHHSSAVASAGGDDRLRATYGQVRVGPPASELAALGLDTAKAEQLSITDLIKRFIPGQKIASEQLNPAVKSCYNGHECTAYIFDDYSDQVVLLLQDGRVTWKIMSTSMLARMSSPWSAA